MWMTLAFGHLAPMLGICVRYMDRFITCVVMSFVFGSWNEMKQLIVVWIVAVKCGVLWCIRRGIMHDDGEPFMPSGCQARDP